jgi:hypothetical protein
MRRSKQEVKLGCFCTPRCGALLAISLSYTTPRWAVDTHKTVRTRGVRQLTRSSRTSFSSKRPKCQWRNTAAACTGVHLCTTGASARLTPPRTRRALSSTEQAYRIRCVVQCAHASPTPAPPLWARRVTRNPNPETEDSGGTEHDGCIARRTHRRERGAAPCRARRCPRGR